MEFLILPSGRSLRKSIKGNRYYWRFIRRIEEECIVCFPQSFYDKEWKLSDFVSYVEKRKQKPSVDLRMATDHLQEEKHYYGLHLIIFFGPITVLLIGFAIYSSLQRHFGFAFVMLAIAAAINWLHSGNVLREMFRLKRLIANLSAETAKPASEKRKMRASAHASRARS